MPGFFSIPGLRPSTLSAVGYTELFRRRGPGLCHVAVLCPEAPDVFRCRTLLGSLDLDLSPIHGLTLPSFWSPPVPLWVRPMS